MKSLLANVGLLGPEQVARPTRGWCRMQDVSLPHQKKPHSKSSQRNETTGGSGKAHYRMYTANLEEISLEKCDVIAPIERV